MPGGVVLYVAEPRFVVIGLAPVSYTHLDVYKRQVVQAAARRGIRTAIHEQNACPGVTNKIRAKQVDLVCAAMPDAVQRRGAPDKTVVTGNPVREEMFRQDRPAARRARCV